MTKLNPLALGLIAGLGLLAAARPASADYNLYATFINPDGTKVPGDPQSLNFPDAIEIQDFSVAATHETVTLPNGRTLVGPDHLSPFSLEARTSVASTTLFRSILNGTPFKSLEVDIQTADFSGHRLAASWTVLTPYLTSFTSLSGDESPNETYTAGAFAELQYKFYSYDANGKVQGTRTMDWMLLANNGNYATTSNTGVVPDFALITGLGTLPVAPGEAGRVTSVATTPEPASLGLLATFAAIGLRRRRRVSRA